MGNLPQDTPAELPGAEARAQFRAAPTAAGVAFLVWAFVGVPGLTLLAALDSEKSSSVMEPVMAALVIALPFAFIGRVLMTAVVASASGLELVGVLRTTRIRWEDISELDVDRLLLRTKQGKVHPLTALRMWRRPYEKQPTSRQQAALQVLDEALAAHRASRT